MAGIPDHVIDEIRQRADIVEVVSDYLPLKKSGANYRSLCPFHEEKTPSFNVNPARQIFHCFGCGEGGNVFSFVMKMESLSFPEAVRMLGKRYGVTIPETDAPKTNSEVERLYEAMEKATVFYHRMLLGQKEGSPLTEYLRRRGLTDEIVKKFRLGWSPDSWDALLGHLLSKGFDEKVIEKAGLVKVSTKGNYIDRFRGRLMFPITNPGGRVIGFGGRIIDKQHKEAAKYINSPETPIYSKSRVLYGFHQAQQAARRDGVMIVVEGYMDALALHMNGVENCVACSGTAFTPRQAELIKRVCDKVVVLFDSDTAGIAAAKRSVPILLDHEINTRVMTLPSSNDPDDFLAEHGVEEFLKLASAAPSFPQFIIDTAVAGADMSDIDGKVRAAREAIPFLRRIKDRIERSHYAQMLADRTGARYETLASEIEQGERPRGPKKNGAEKQKNSAIHKAERILVRILLENPEYLKDMASDLEPDDFTDSVHRKMFELLADAAARGTVSAADVISMAEDDDLRKNISSLSLEQDLFDDSDAETIVKDCVKRLRYGPEKRKRALEALKSADIGELSKAQKKYFEFRKKQV